MCFHPVTLGVQTSAVTCSVLGGRRRRKPLCFQTRCLFTPQEPAAVEPALQQMLGTGRKQCPSVLTAALPQDPPAGLGTDAVRLSPLKVTKPLPAPVSPADQQHPLRLSVAPLDVALLGGRAKKKAAQSSQTEPGRLWGAPWAPAQGHLWSSTAGTSWSTAPGSVIEVGAGSITVPGTPPGYICSG